MTLSGCSQGSAPPKGLSIGARVEAPAGVAERLSATFADDSSSLTTVPLTAEDPNRTAAAVATLRHVGSPLPEPTVSGPARSWSTSVLAARADDAALRVQNLRTGVRAFGPHLDPAAVGTAVSATVRELLRGEPTLADLENAARLVDEVRPALRRSRDARNAADGPGEALAAHLGDRPGGCRTEAVTDALPDYVAVRGLARLGHRCAVGAETETAVARELARLGDSTESWSVPEAVLLLQVANAAHTDGKQDAETVGKVGDRARRTLRDALTAEGPYYRKSPVTLTEAAAAASALTEPPSPKDMPVAVSPALDEALRNAVLMRGRIPDQPDGGSAVDGYLATVARARLEGSPVRVAAVPAPAADASLRAYVRYFLAASLRGEDPPGRKETADLAGTALKRADNPLDGLTLATSASLAAARDGAPCAVVDTYGTVVDAAVRKVVAEHAQGSDAVKSWLALLWNTTSECTGFRERNASTAAALGRATAAETREGVPTKRAVNAWVTAETACAASKAPRVGPVPLDGFAAMDEDPGEGLGLGVFAALRVQEIGSAKCGRTLAEILGGDER